MSQHSKGSSDHILTWTDKSPEIFVKELNELINLEFVNVSADDDWMPKGHNNSKEALIWDVPDNVISQKNKAEIRKWWLKHYRPANTPNWDFFSTCKINHDIGLILLEAKAHFGELEKHGKRFNKNPSEKSKENHCNICKAIAEANRSLKQVNAKVNLSIETHYQLVNRISYAWKISSLGIPVILIYLGFIGDKAMSGHFNSEKDWESCIEGYIKDVFPKKLAEKPIEAYEKNKSSAKPFWFLIRTRAV